MIIKSIETQIEKKVRRNCSTSHVASTVAQVMMMMNRQSANGNNNSLLERNK